MIRPTEPVPNRLIHWSPAAWQGSWRLPGWRDPRWAAFGLLGTYLILGVTVLGFARRPLQIAATVLFGMAIDALLNGLLKGRKAFPLSAAISCLSLAILLNFSLGYHFLWLPAFVMAASKHVLTFRGRHAFNPSMFAIVFCLLFGHGWISLSPAYQWTGTAATAWAMSAFIVTAAVLLFALRIERHWFILAFLAFYALQIALRGWLMRFHIPFSTLVVGTLTSAPFFLFAFFMITDPATSPPTPRKQAITAFFIVLLDLWFHTKASLFTFFYAGATVAGVRLAWAHGRALLAAPRERLALLPAWFGKATLLAAFALPIIAVYLTGTGRADKHGPPGLAFRKLPVSVTGIDWAKSDLLDRVDPRARNVGKWMLSVGDAVAVADVDGDGRQDIFLTQAIKAPAWRGKLYLNQGGFAFRKLAIPDLERYMNDAETYGLPSAALFFDYDNDGDPDLLVGFSYGNSHLFRNDRGPEGLRFSEVHVPFLDSNRSMCLAANALDFDGDGRLDILMADAIPPYLADYPGRVPFSIFKLPQPEYPGDRRMFHFMHDSWQKAENGGRKHLLLNDGKGGFREADAQALGLTETRWSLAIGTADLDGDGRTDIYVANDFGRDDCYLNRDGRFERQQGRFYEDLGLDTYKGMNVSMADVDGDGREDVYVSNVHHALQAEGSLLWLNHTRPGAAALDMEESATRLGALNPDRFGWGATFADLDLDGRPDLIQANGMVNDAWDKLYPECRDYWYLNEKLARSQPGIHSYSDKWADIRGACIYGSETERVYWNGGKNGFVDVSLPVGISDTANTRAVAAADFDNDGDLDLIITDQFGAPKLYENLLPPDREWIGLDLAGGGSCNAEAVGTKVWVEYGPREDRKRQYRESRLGNGFSSQGDRRMVFGLGMKAGREIDLEVTVQWCGRGEKQVFTGLRPGRYARLTPSSERVAVTGR